jgi:uncharacterized protein YukE
MDEIKKLYDVLIRDGYYSKSFDDFQLQFSNPEYVDKVYNVVTRDGLYSKDKNSFVEKYSLKKKDLSEIPTVSGLETGTLDLPEPEVYQEPLGFFEGNFGKGMFFDLLDDTILDIRRGFAQGASLKQALKLQRKGSKATPEDIDRYVDVVNKMQSIPITDEMRNFQKIYEENDRSWLGFVKGALNNPSVLTGVVAQSVASMLNPQVAFGAIKGGVGGGIVGGAGGLSVGGPLVGLAGLTKGAQYGAIAGLTNTLEAGLAFTEFLQEEIEKNPDLKFDDEGIAAVLNDDEAFKRIKSRTKARGYSIATVNAITYGVANQLARAGRNIKRLKYLPSPQTALRKGTEFVGGGLGEVAGRAAAGQEMDVAEVGFEAFGEVLAPESVIPTFQNAVYSIDGERVNKVDVMDMLEGDPEALLKTEITIKNDESFDAEVQAAVKKAITVRNVKNGLTPEQRENITDEQLNNLVDLQLELDNEKSSESQVGEDNAIETKQKIKQITDAIQKPSPEKVDVQKPAPDSEAVGERDIQQQPVTGKVTPEPVEPEAKPAEEVTPEVETKESQVEPALTQENLLENETLEEGEHSENKGRVFTKIAQVTEKDGVTTTKFFFNKSDKDKSQRAKGKVSEKALEKRGYQISKEDKETFEDDFAEGVTVNYEVTEIRESESGAAADVTVTYTRPDGTQDTITGSVTLEPFVETEQVEETYTLPENPIEAKKDFEIIDNRNQKAGLEIDEDGNGKYYVENIKTGKIVAVKTKKEAQETIQNPKSFDYGEGQPVLEEFRTKVIEEVVEAPIEAAPTDKVRKIGNFEVIITEDNKIKSIKKDGKEVSAQGRRNAEKLIMQSGEIDVTKGEDAQLDKGMSELEVSEKIARESNNPSQIAKEIQFIKEKKKNQKQELKNSKESGLPSMFTKNKKFTPESIEERLGTKISELGKGFKETWVSETGDNIREGYLEEVSDDLKIDHSEADVTDFIKLYPNVTKYNQEFLSKLTQLQKDLENKFEETTGITPTEGNIKLASSPELIAEVAEKSIFEAERKAEEKPIVEKEKVVKKKESPEEIKSIQDDINELSKPVNKITSKILRLNFGNAYAYIKNTLAKGKGVINVIQEQLRSIPTTKIDFILGNENSTLFYRKLFLPLVKSYQQYADRFKQKEKIILEAQDQLLREAKGDRNKAKINGFKIAIAQKAKIHESNPDSNVTPPVIELLDFTIKLANSGRLAGVNKRTAKELEKLKNQYQKNGEITFENVYNSLTPTQKKVYNTLQEENKKLEPFAQKAAERRGIELEMLNDYSHRVVLSTRNEEIDIIEKKANDFSNESLRGKNLLERTEGVKAVSFDPFLSSLRGTQEVYLDYYMSPDVSKVQKIAAGLLKKYENGNEGQVAATIGLEETLRELLRVTYLRSFVPSGYGTNIATEAKRIGYRLLLGSAPRFVAELAGNSAMLLAEKPSVVRDAVTKYGSFSLKTGSEANNNYINLLTELGSGETDKMGGRLQADSKYSDRNGILNISREQRSLYNPILNKLDKLSRLPKKLTYDKVASVSDFLMSGGDRVISRPIWVSKFADQFKQNVKKELGEDIDISVKDLNEISKGESKYLKDSKYKNAIDKAVFEADKTVINISTSANPFNAIAKNVKRGDVKDYYRTINSFMANFTLNEYATARMAIGALVNSGEMSPRQAGFLLTGVLARMSSYVIAYGLLADLMDEEIFGAPEEEDEELDSLIKRQLIGSVLTLMFRQNLGNIPSLPVNLAIEEFNKQYLDELRDGKPYNSYDNSIVYSLITLDRLDKGLEKQIIPILTGPYVEYYKSAMRAIELYNRSKTRKTKEARDRAVKELEEVIGLQLIGQLQMIPLYKDFLRAKRKKFYKENYESQGGGGGSSTPVVR